MWDLEENWVKYYLQHGELKRILNSQKVKYPKIKSFVFLKSYLGYSTPLLYFFLSLSLFLSVLLKESLSISFSTVSVSLSLTAVTSLHSFFFFFFNHSQGTCNLLKKINCILTPSLWDLESKTHTVLFNFYFLTGWANLSDLNVILQRSYTKVVMVRSHRLLKIGMMAILKEFIIPLKVVSLWHSSG